MTLATKIIFLLNRQGITDPDPVNDYRVQRMVDGTDALVFWRPTLPIPRPTDEELLLLETNPELLRKQKGLKRDAINAEAERRIVARWPLSIQSSVHAGLYPALATVMADDIASVVATSNVARDALYAMTTLAKVDAYDPLIDPVWPTIGTYTQKEPV